jgi:hypothetical protein
MKRIIMVTLAVTLAALTAGCGQEASSDKTLPPSSSLFDKKEMPNNPSPGGGSSKTAKTANAN